MQLSKGFDYAVRSLIYLASQPKEGAAELRSIAESARVPVSYLAKVMRSLVRGGLVASTLGRDGGYALRRSPRDVTLLMVYRAIEGEIRLVDCMDQAESCVLYQGCRQMAFWKKLKGAVEGVLSETTLSDLMASAPGFEEKETPHVSARP